LLKQDRLVPGGTTVTVPAAHGFGQSENELGAKNMAIERIFRKTAVALVAGAYCCLSKVILWAMLKHE